MLATTNNWSTAIDDVIADSGCSENPELDDTGSPSALIRCQLYSGLPLTRLAARSGSLAELSAIIVMLGTLKNRMRGGPGRGSWLKSALLPSPCFPRSRRRVHPLP